MNVRKIRPAAVIRLCQHYSRLGTFALSFDLLISSLNNALLAVILLRLGQEVNILFPRLSSLGVGLAPIADI